MTSDPLRNAPAGQNHPIDAFVGRNADYYRRAFERIQAARNPPWRFNPAAAAFGPLWAATRGAWNFYWLAAGAELFACVQIARGWFGELGADGIARARSLHAVAAQRLADATSAAAGGQTQAAETFTRIAHNLELASAEALAESQRAADGALPLLGLGIALLLAVKLAEGLLADASYERQYTAWRTDKRVPAGRRAGRGALGAALLALIGPLTVYRFTASELPAALAGVPVDLQWFKRAAGWIDGLLEALYQSGSGGFDGIRDAIRWLVRLLEGLLLTLPWPVVMLLIVVLAWRAAGHRVALLATGSIAYLALLGMWVPAMQTVALLGSAALLCVALGIPLGILLASSERAHALARPLLDLMQTMPALVYLIPAIAFFGTGTPPGIIATLIFGMPPVVRLTALGIRQVPAEIREAALACGASRWQLLSGVELPLARATIMAGVNQTVLMCLSMVVIAALIGAPGLGTVVLEALQFGAAGQGILAGIGILLCAILIDRIVQGR